MVEEKGSVCQVTNYYPFGTPYSDETSITNSDLQPYKYNSKELDRMHGLDTYDYGARQYDPVLCRWDRIDPLCEKYYSVSPYAYCMNKPVKNVDPDGREVLNVFPNRGLENKANETYISKLDDSYNSIIIFGHGVYGNGIRYYEGTNYSDLTTSSQLVEFLDTNSEVWNSRYVLKDGVNIVLFSCETGKEGGLAEQVSTDFAAEGDYSNITIYAPGDNADIDTKTGKISVENGQGWNKFVDGKLVDTTNGTILPGTDTFNNSSIWELYKPGPFIPVNNNQ